MWKSDRRNCCEEAPDAKGGAVHRASQRKLLDHYGEQPSFLTELAATPLMQRLGQVGMNCGCEYTQFPLFAQCQPYSRLDHSLGAARIVWHFTGDKAAAAAGLLHDIATPVFAHVIDFLHGDHLKQESTEHGTYELIQCSAEIQTILHKYGLTTAQVADYHQYPIADNDTPRLSADRLEYTLGNLVSYGFGTVEDVRLLYKDIVVLAAPDGMPELGFCTPETALRFAALALQCSQVYVADADRFAMQALAELIRNAITGGVLAEEDLYTTEPQVIGKLLAAEETAEQWKRFTQYSRIKTEKERPAQGYWLQVSAKKRFIDPLIQGGIRVSEQFPSFEKELSAFLSESFDEWLSAE